MIGHTDDYGLEYVPFSLWAPAGKKIATLSQYLARGIGLSKVQPQVQPWICVCHRYFSSVSTLFVRKHFQKNLKIMGKKHFLISPYPFFPATEATLIRADGVTFTHKLQTWRWQLTKTLWRENMCVRFSPRQTLLTIGETVHGPGWLETKYVIEKASKLVSRGAELHQSAPAAGWETSATTY